jgi:hypothetical protein
MDNALIILIVVIALISSSSGIMTIIGGGGTAYILNQDEDEDEDEDDRDTSWMDEEWDDDGVSMKDNPFFQVKIAKNELIEAEKALMAQKAKDATQDSIDKAAAKVEYAKKKIEWIKCYSERDCLNTCVRFGDKVRIVKESNNKNKLSLKKGNASEVSSNGDDTLLVFQDLEKDGKTGHVKIDEDLNNISQKCITYGDLTRIAKYSDQNLALKMKSGKAYGSIKDEDSIHTKFVIEGGSGNVNYGDKIRISKEGRYKLRLLDRKAVEKKEDDHEGSYFIIVKA